MEADHLDQAHDLGLGAAEDEVAAAEPQAAGEVGEVHHQGGVGEAQLTQVHDHVGRDGLGLGEGAAAQALRRDVLVAAAAQDGPVFVEPDDAPNLPDGRG